MQVVKPNDAPPPRRKVLPNDAPPPKPVAAAKPPKKKSGFVKYIAALAAALAVVAAVVVLWPRGTEPEPEDNKQVDWTAWADQLPEGISDEDYEIEEQTLYSSRTLESTTSDSATMDGWELVDTKEAGAGYGSWSSWSATATSGSNSRQVETKPVYRYRNLQTTTSSSRSLSGWELYDTTYSWGNYGSWSSWSTTPVSGSSSRKVETKTQYRYRSISYRTEYTDWSSWSDWSDSYVSGSDLRDVETRTVWGYYYFQCPYCGCHWHGHTYVYCWSSWGVGGCGASTPIPESSAHQIWSTISWSDAGLQEWHGTGKYYTYNINGERVFKWDNGDGDPKTQYRYRTRSTRQVAEYGSWSSWSDSPVSASSSRDVEKRTVYRYCDRSQVPTYHFRRWGSWSSWSDSAVSSTSQRQVETGTYYRYRDQVTSTTYYFQRWTDWTDYDETPITASDTVEVRTQTQYRYRSRDT